jgi:hypothetical protein
MNFNLGTAPASGINLGLPIVYKPTSSGHPSYSSWLYSANGGAIQAMAGCQTSSMSFTLTANAQAQAEFTYDGTESFYNPIVITATNKYVDFTDDVGTVVAEMAEKVYKTPLDLASEISNKMTAASVGSGNDTITVTYNSQNGKYTIASDGTTLSLLWNSGANTANTIGADIGFDTAADDTAATSYEGDNALDLSAQFTPSFDDASQIILKGAELMIGSFDDNICRESQEVTFTVDRPNTDVDDLCATSGVAEKVPESRTVSMSATLTMERYEAELFDRLLNATDTTIMVNIGPKDGSGNWVAGKCVNFYMQNATITAHNLEGDTFVQVALEAKGFITTSKKDFYINYL